MPPEQGEEIGEAEAIAIANLLRKYGWFS